MDYHDLALVDINLIDDCRYFDHLLAKAEDYHSYFKEPESIKKEFLNQVKECLKLQISNQDSYLHKIFRFSNSEKLLYALIKFHGQTKLLTWNFESLIENLNYTAVIRGEFKIPLAQNNVVVFQNYVENCPINFYSLVIKNIYN